MTREIAAMDLTARYFEIHIGESVSSSCFDDMFAELLLKSQRGSAKTALRILATRAIFYIVSAPYEKHHVDKWW